MEPAIQRTHRDRGLGGPHDDGKRPFHRNKQWVAGATAGRNGANSPHAESDGERRDRNGHRGSWKRNRGFTTRPGSGTVKLQRDMVDGGAAVSEGEYSGMEDDMGVEEVYPPDPETPEEREKFWQELVKAREMERKKAIAEGKMDDPLVQKSLKDAITMVGTCQDMCPRFERYRRERENHLLEWETIPGTKRVDHKRAVKMYERAAGDKTLPSDLRPPNVLKRTLDYLFHDLLPRGGFSATFSFIRDRSRAVRNDFTMQHQMGPIAIECHDRCARFHILSLHLDPDNTNSFALEEQQLMNTLQSLKEFYEDQRPHYQSPTELEMRVYHRLIHIRDQKERHEDIPQPLLDHPVFELITKFRARVQAKSAPITKSSTLSVDGEAMQIFTELAGVLRREGNVVMTYLIACILERLFGKDTIENIEALRGELSYSDIIDGYSGPQPSSESITDDVVPEVHDLTPSQPSAIRPLQPSGTQWLNNNFGPVPTASAFSHLATVATEPSPFVSARSAFSDLPTVPNVFGTATFGASSVPADSTPSAFSFPVPSVNSEASTTNFSLSPFIPAASPGGQSGFPLQINGFTPHGQGSIGSVLSTRSGLTTSDTHPTSLHSASQSNGLQAKVTPSSIAFEVRPPILTPSSSAIGHALNPSLQLPFDNSSTTPFSFPNKALVDNQPPPVHATNTGSQVSSSPAHTVAVELDSHPALSTPNRPPPSSPSNDLLNETPPTQPPPLTKHRPISLPSTPTTSSFIPPFAPQSPNPKSLFGSLKNIHIQTSLSSAPTEILSPLVIPSPSASRVLPSTAPNLLRDAFQPPLKTMSAASNIEACDDRPPGQKQLSERVDTALMDATAVRFSRQSSLVKKYFLHWRQRLSDRVKWLEACKRSELYSERVQAERLSRSTTILPSEKKRKAPLKEPGTPLKKRMKNRVSSEYRPPHNDEELVVRFEKNHKVHESRWARGSFLHILRNHLDSSDAQLRPEWVAWLSPNQENDSTAIWLEQKFDVPNSGEWKTENIFQMQVSKSHINAGSHYPGVVVFERTPLSEQDVIEKKYQILDDCARLRAVIEALPQARHYIPSLICISWSCEPPDVTKDFDGMVAIALEDGLFTSYHELVVASATMDMELKLEELLKSVPFDREGLLVKWVLIDDLFKLWEPIWLEVTAWLAKCAVRGTFRWDIYASFLHASIQLLYRISSAAVALLRDGDGNVDLPTLNFENIVDSDSAFDVILGWLEELPTIEITIDLSNDISTHRKLGHDFPTFAFVPQLYALARALVVHMTDIDPGIQFCVIKARMETVSKSLLSIKSDLEDEFKLECSTRSRIAPKRASLNLTSDSASDKRGCLSLSVSETSHSDEECLSVVLYEPSPSLSATSVPPLNIEETPLITLKMLRSLTRDIRAKYGIATSRSPS